MTPDIEKESATRLGKVQEILWKEKIAGTEMLICKICGYFGHENIFNDHKCWESVQCPIKQ